MTELGNRLKEARLEKGMNLDDLQTATKIQKRYLQGIEEGNYSMMPGPFYVRAFIKQYAEAVGLQPEEIFTEYKSEIPTTLNEDLPEKISRVRTRKQFSSNSSKFIDMLPKILLALFIIGFLVVIWYFTQGQSKDNSNPQVQPNKEGATYEKSEDLTSEDANKKPLVEDNDEGEEEEEETEKVKTTQELVVAESAGQKTIYELKNTEAFVLKVVSTGETWVNIKNDNGESFFSGMLTKNGQDSHTHDFSNESGAVIKVGRAIDTEIYINDQKLDYAIPADEKVTQDITIRFEHVAQ